MQEWPPNPYYNKGIVREPELCFGRTELMQRLFEVISQRQSVSLVGPRGIGKSSLLWQVSLPSTQSHAPFKLQRHLFVFLDLREYLSRTSSDFFHNVSKALKTRAAQAGLKLHTESQGEDEFSDYLDQLAENDYFPVLLLDSFDQITQNKHFTLAFFEFLRAHASLGLIAFITASRKPLIEVCHHGIAGSPFFNIFYPYTLEALDQQEACDLIKLPAQRLGIEFTDREVETVLKLAGRHPFFLNRVCFRLYEAKKQHSNGEIEESMLKTPAYRDLSDDFTNIWNQLSPPHQAILLDEAQQRGHTQRSLPEMSESSLFRIFVRTTCRTRLFYLEVEQLEVALDQLGDLNALAEVDLRLMQTVAQRLQKYPFPSLQDRGMVIREVLTEAFERLKGDGQRTDLAPDWLVYNILYYRFFRYRLKNDLIVTRLGLGNPRKYYRERNRALKALLESLKDIEHAVGGFED